MEYQVTLICESGRYKPVSCVVKADKVELTKENKRALVRKGTEKICIKHYWTSADLKRFGYTRAKVREYDKESQARYKAEAEARYEAIKEAHYADGTWQRPKKVKEKG